MKKVARTLMLGVTCFVTITLSAVTAFGDTPEEKLSRLLLGSIHPIKNSYQPNRKHAGVDFGGTGNGKTTVESPLTGKIVANTAACGKVAIFDGRNTVILAHMTSRTSLAVGKTISVGDYVGKAAMVLGGGCSATGPHLHVEVRTGNNATMGLPTNDNRKSTKDPITYLVNSELALDPKPTPTTIPTPTPAPTTSTFERFDLNGEWIATGYPEAGEIRVRVLQAGDKVEAIKLTSGSSNVPAGAVTWFGTYTSNSFFGKIQAADADFTNRRLVEIIIRVSDNRHIVVTMISDDPVTGQRFGPLKFEKLK